MTHDNVSHDQVEALMHKIGGREGLEKLLAGEWTLCKPADPAARVADLLDVVGDPLEAPAVERFVARDRFVAEAAGELPIRYVGEDFTAHFLGVVEEAVPAARLSQYELVKSSIDGPIFAALGGEGEARIALAHLYAFLKTADRTRWFFFYVADAAGKLWAVDAYWREHGWDLEAYSVTYPRGWRGGGRVVSR
ncbi:hypothetical protein [Novosphingobium resinovorum]|uniref:hypothetical protein n=1 Tax=Novosphingobium resinovorum TaxID=158500 RepID=UPI002ED3444D|nr:hypothetical protein [Novosphingobium resinovorum]